MYFKVQQQADVVAFEVSEEFRTTLVNNPATFFADKMADFSRAKSREIEELRRERDNERAYKVEAMAEIEKIVKMNE